MQSVRRILRGNYGFAFKKEIQLTNNKPESVNASTDNHIAVRGKGQVMVVLEELQECISATDNVEQIVDESYFTNILNRFLASLPKQKRIIFFA